MNVVEFLNTLCFYKDKQTWEYEIKQEQLRQLRSGN